MKANSTHALPPASPGNPLTPGSRRRISRLMLALTASVIIAFPGHAEQSEPPGTRATVPAAVDFFLDPPGSSGNDPAATDKATRSRPTRVNQAAAAAAQPDQVLRLHLFEDADWYGKIQHVEERGPMSYTLAGKLTHAEDSSFTISVNEAVVVGNFRDGKGGYYQLRYLENGLNVIRAVDESKFPRCATGPEHLVATADDAQAELPATGEPDTGAVIDVMVVYTPSARTAVGGTAAMQALINLAVDESNTAYRESRINPRLRLVHSAEVAYTESGNFSTDLNRLTTASDGFMDNVQSLRNTYGADMVSLFINDSSSCGIGWLMTSLSTSFENRAFSVVHHDCATGYYSFAHELGHNMGCHHDRANSSSTPLYPYSYGWRFFGNSGTEYRTVMSYAPGIRIQRFSNPEVLYDGRPTGRPVGYADQAYNALCINNVAYTVANFRQTICAYSLNASSASFTATGGSGSVSVSTSSGCPWTATSGASWVVITTGSSGSGAGAVTYSVAANTTASSRSATLTIAGQSYTISQQAAAPCLPTAITIPTTVSGALAGTDCASNHRGSGYYADRYTFTGTAGQQVAIALSSASFDTYLYLVTPTGAVLSDDDGGGGTNSRLPVGSGYYTLPASGTYTIEVTSYASGAIGSYTLSASQASGCTYSISPGNAAFPRTGGTGSVAVSASSGCTWNAASQVSWITIQSGSTGNGNGVVSYQVAANKGKQSRTGTMVIAGRTFTVTQAGR